MSGIIYSDHRENHGAIPYMEHQLQENNNKYKNSNIKYGGGFMEHKILENMQIGDYILLTQSKNKHYQKNNETDINSVLETIINTQVFENENETEIEIETETEKEIEIKTEIETEIEIEKEIETEINNELYIISAIFERKTWSDLSGSIKDNRLNEQINNMIHIRDKLNCYLYLIIEGNLTYADDRKVNGLPFKNLHAKLRSLSLKGIHYIQTKNPEHTAKLLINMSRDIMRLYINDEITLNEKMLISPNGLRATLIKKEVNDSDVINKMWKSIKGISDMLAIIMMDNFNFKEFFTENADVIISKISVLKYYSSNRNIGPKNAKNIINNSRMEGFELKFLTNIKGVSINIAKSILNTHTFLSLFYMDDVSKLVDIKCNSRKIPKPACEKIIKFLNK